MKKIRVVHILTSLAPGGAETNLLALLRWFDNDRFEHIIAYGGGGALEDEFRKTGAQLLKLATGPLSPRMLFSFSAMIRSLGAVKPDILHAHLDMPNLLSLLAKKRLGCKLVIHLHGLGVIPRNMLPGRVWSHNLWNTIARLYKRCDHAIAICSFQLPFLEKLGIAGRQITLIPNGIDLNANGKSVSVSTDPYRFINVARFYPQKNHQLLIRAFHKVNRHIPATRLLLVGDGPVRPEIEQLVRELDVSECVDFLGIRRDVTEILSDCHCFVLSSRWELHPITILEAMRAGLPVIATDVGGVGDTVEHGVSGLLVNSENEKELVQAMLQMAAQPESSRAMGAQGIKIVVDRFSNERVAKRIEAVYHAVLGS